MTAVRPPCWLLLAAGCVSGGPLDLGPAVIGVHLSTDTDVAALVPLRGGAVAALVTEVRSDRSAADAPIAGAAVEVRLPSGALPLAEVADGLYASSPLDAPALYAAPGTVSTVDVAVDGAAYGLGAALPPVLPLALDPGPYPPDEDLVVPLPDGWADDYDYVLAELVGPSGVVWSAQPTTLRGWLELLGDPPQPDALTIPAEALDPATVSALGVFFLQQLDRDAAFHGPVNEPASSYIAGTAWLEPLALGF
ncbi:MAG: hypothetical protein R3F59_36280 [Myxococcota bacterium]